MVSARAAAAARPSADRSASARASPAADLMATAMACEVSSVRWLQPRNSCATTPSARPEGPSRVHFRVAFSPMIRMSASIDWMAAKSSVMAAKLADTPAMRSRIRSSASQ